MGMDTSEILFTRQRHEAIRAGLHYDIRLVHGDLAYSWATKKDMPKPGEAIILHQQPIHDSGYALSEKVEIPVGQYGAGVTYLDFVRKAHLHKSEDGDHFVISTKDGEEYLLKHVPKYGPKQWLFKNITGHKKKAEYTEGPESTFTHEGKLYTVDDILRKVRSLPVKNYKVEDLKWVLEHTKVDPDRVAKADLEHPVIISPSKDGRLVAVDGAHRLTKAVQEGKEELPGKYIEKLAILLTLWENAETNEKKWFKDIQQPHGPGWRRTSATLYKHKKEGEKLIGKAGLVKKAKEQAERPHTARALKKIEKQDGLVVDHSMGSGKTRLYLKAIENYQKKNPKEDALVIAPASLTSNIAKEIKKHGIKIDQSKLETLSYEKASIDAERLKKKVYGMVVADEAHKLRNTGTKRHRELSEVIVNAKKRILGTGTTAYNHPSDVAPLVNLAAGKSVLPEGRSAFEAEYVEKLVEQPSFLKRITGHPPKEIQKLKNKKRLEKILREHIDHYDLKDDPEAADKFPTKKETIKEVEMSPEQHSLYRYMEGKLPWHLRLKVRMNMPLDRKDVASLQAFSTGIRQVSNSVRSYMPKYEKTTPKIEAAVNSLVERGNKDKNFRGLVYSNYLESGLDDYSQELHKRGVPHAIYHGGLTKKKKDELLEQYNSGKLPVLLLSSSGAEGLNTKGTKLVQVMEPHFNKSKIDQVVARAIRYQSHSHLPAKERTVDVEHYHSVLPKSRWKIGPNQHSIDQYLHHNSKSKSELGDEMKSLVKEAGYTVDVEMVKIALNALKAREMAKKVGVIADHTTQWKYALRKLRSGDGKVLDGPKLEKAKVRMGAIRAGDFQKIVNEQRNNPGKELGFGVDRNGRIGDIAVGEQNKVKVSINKNTQRLGHTHPADPNAGKHYQGPRITHASGLDAKDLPFKPRKLKETVETNRKVGEIVDTEHDPKTQMKLLKQHGYGVVGHQNPTSGVLTGGIRNRGKDLANALTMKGQKIGPTQGLQNIVSTEQEVDAVHKTTGHIYPDGTIHALKHRTVMFKRADLMVKCEDLLNQQCLMKSAAVTLVPHNYVRAKYKEMESWDHIVDPVGSLKRDGAAFFMEFDQEGKPRFLSRRESVKGGFPDRTANLLHLPDVRLPHLAGNVYHVELVHTGHDYHDTSEDSHAVLSGILNSNPPRALDTQAKIGPVRAVLLDVVNPKIPTFGEKLVHLAQVKQAFGDVPNLHMPLFKIGRDEISQLLTGTKEQGHEGVVITSMTHPEEKNIRVKVKHVDTYNLEVTRVIQEIDKNGNPKESMGALAAKDATGREVAKVGTGFTKEMRKWFWDNRETVPGMLIQVKAMPSTSSRLRSPVYNGQGDGDLDTVQERFTQ